MPNISKIFNGSIYYPEPLLPTIEIAPPRGYAWIVLGGSVDHITLTATDLTVYHDKRMIHRFLQVVSATATADNIPIFNTFGSDTGYVGAQWTPFIITDRDTIHFSGDTGSQALLEILEFEYK